MKKIHFSILTLLTIVLTVSCNKDEVKQPEKPKVTSGVYTLNEGNFGANNTTLTYYDFSDKKATTDYYKNVNGSGLGDTGNDMILYGGKLYIVMNVSSYLEVADAGTAKSVKKIDLKDTNGQPLTPRHITSHGKYVFVSCWSGSVAVIDTATLAITKQITVGANPEQMVVSGNKLYVTNSGGITPGYDSTVSVIDLNTLAEVSKIKVGKNPGAVEADDAGNIYVGFIGDYGDIKPGLVKINTGNNSIVKSSELAVAKLKYFDGKLYATGGYLGSPNVQIISTTNLTPTSSNFVTDGTKINIPYGLNIDPVNGDVYVGDMIDYVSPGKVYCFDKEGKQKFSFSVDPGVGPNSIVFIKK